LCQEPCPSGCICWQQSNWQTEELVLVSLQEIEIQGFGRSEHDIGFVEQLFGWAISLTMATIFFDESVTEGVAKELCWMFQFFRMPKLHIDFRYHNNKKVPEESILQSVSFWQPDMDTTCCKYVSFLHSYQSV